MYQALFVDCHSHVVPSGDDGATSVGDGVALCKEAARHGTRVLFATPHVWPHLTLSEVREAAIRGAFAALAPRAELELRLGFELTPSASVLEEDPHRYLLECTDAVLMEAVFHGPLDLLVALGEHTERSGLRPVVAHPERAEAIQVEPALAHELAERGWLLQVNATSLLGRHGPHGEEVGWRLLEEGVAQLVGSDGHRTTRPAHLDAAFAAAEERLGERALAFFDGSALGLSLARPRVLGEHAA